MPLVVLITTKDKAEAKKIIDFLLMNKLIACANIIDSVSSLFWWNDKIDKASEVLIVAKTKKTKFKRIIKEVKSLHSYDVPEIIALPIIDGNPDYLKWINDSIN